MNAAAAVWHPVTADAGTAPPPPEGAEDGEEPAQSPPS